jgi:ATP-dependent protease HslVU (ClpYQ) peptidase subunit
MSVVAVKKYPDKIVLGADSQVTIGQNKDKISKIFKINEEFGFGVVGLAKDCMLFYYFQQTNKIKETNTIEDIYDYLLKYADFVKDKTGVWGAESQFLIVNKNKAFKASINYVEEIEDYCAIGSGEDFAQTALYFNKDVEEAIKVACDLTIYCGEPIITYKFK